MSPETLDMLAFAGLLFALRVLNYAISTIRLVFIARSRRLLAALLAFLEALIFAVVMASVVTDLNNIMNLLAYCLGAAVGSFSGMLLEQRLFTSYRSVHVIMQKQGPEVAAALREANYAVTETLGRGRDGEVMILRSSAATRDIPAMIRIIHGVNPDAFIEVEDTRAIHRGWIPGLPARR